MLERFKRLNIARLSQPTESPIEAKARPALASDCGRYSGIVKALARLAKGALASFFVTGLIFYVALSPFIAGPLYDAMLFHPDRSDYSKLVRNCGGQLKKELSVQSKELTILTPDGRRLAALYFKKPGACKLILVSHGNGGNIGSRMIVSAALLCCDASVLQYDYEGYGKSDGKPSVRAMVRDGLAAYDFAVDQLHYSASQIIDYGESIGTGVAVQIAQQRAVAGIILSSGFLSLYTAGTDAVFFVSMYPSCWFDDLDNLSALKKPHPPLLILHGDRDHILKEARAVELYQQASGPKRFVELKDFGHGLERIDDMQFLRAIRSFLGSIN